MISIFFLGIILAILVWNYCYRVLWSKNVAVFVQFKEQAVYAGKQAAIVEKVENRKRMPLPVLEVSFHFEKGLLFHDMENTVVSDYTYKRDVFALLGNQRITRTLTLDCNKRGYYSIDKLYGIFVALPKTLWERTADYYGFVCLCKTHGCF